MAEPNSAPYEDITLIDCNRLNSEEVKAGNTNEKSLFTNKTGTGFRLNSGDKVSVHSGFISERGCGGSVIEFNERDLNKTISNTYTKKNLFQAPIPRPGASAFGNAPPDNSMCIHYTTETDTYQLKDNLVKFKINYYKSANGEGYFHLPRRYDANKPPFPYVPQTAGKYGVPAPTINLRDWAHLLVSSQITAGQDPMKTPGAGADKFDAPYGIPAQWFDTYANGLPFPINARVVHPVGKDPRFGVDTTTVPNASLMALRVCWSDMYYYDKGHKPTVDSKDDPYTSNGIGVEGLTLLSKQEWIYDRTADLGTFQNLTPADFWMKDNFLSEGYKYRNNGDRFTIFNKQTNYRGLMDSNGSEFPDITKLKTDYHDAGFTENTGSDRNDFNTAWSGVGINPHNQLSKPREPCFSEYILYEELKTITATPGYSAPHNVANDITNQLNKTGDIQTTEINAGGEPGYYAYDQSERWFSGDPVRSQNITTGAHLSAECYKPMNCATSRSFQMKNYTEYCTLDKPYDTSDVIPADPSTAPPPNAYVPGLLEYLASHESIGFKRPDLIIAGRNFAKLLGGTFIKDESLPKDNGLYQMKPNYVVGVKGVEYEAENISWREMAYPCVYNPNMTSLGEATPTTILKTTIPWTEQNLKSLKTLFETQGKYPDLWTNNRLEYKQSNTRFLHMNQGDIHYNNYGADMVTYPDAQDVTDKNITSYGYEPNPGNTGWNVSAGVTRDIQRQSILGDDGMDRNHIQFNSAPNLPTLSQRGSNDAITGKNFDYSSMPLFFYYDESRKDISNGGGDDGELYYGFAYKYKCELSNNPTVVSDDPYWAIGFTTAKIGGINTIYNTAMTWGDTATGLIESYRPIGYDCHFNAYGNSAICLYAGYLDRGISESETDKFGTEYSVQMLEPEKGTMKSVYVFQNWSKYYVGANNPKLSFDTDSARFSWESLYTPEQIGNEPGSGASITDPVIDDANENVYKINKQLLRTNYCPDMLPYMFGSAPTNTGGTRDKVATSIPNTNIQPYSIMDAHSGIFITDFGIPADKWDDSLWGILGFTYEQFNQFTTLSRQARTNNISITEQGAITTNANVLPSTLNEWVVNYLGVPLYTQQIPGVFTSATTGISTGHSVLYQPISVIQSSSQINAEKLPRKMIRPYFLIKSDIVTDVNYLGGVDSGQALNIVYVVNKENAFGDYFFQSDSQTEFTITKPRTLTSITTSIHNPDMSLATLSNDSAIIYKITKMNSANSNVIQQVLSQNKK
tara:strand:+ start:13563 stop:17318 length:3756 start_codon:yes stop_codon:yes gene_type:complete